MAIFDLTWYANYGDGSTTGYYAIPKWVALTAYTAGQIVRQNAAPAVNSERAFVCIIAGTSLASEPTWVLTYGAKTAEAAGPTWMEITGRSAVNGDITNTPTWTTVKNKALVLGQIIQRNNAASYQIVTTAGTTGNGSEPAFSNTAGTTTADNTVTWTSLGVVGNFAVWANPFPRVQSPTLSTFMASGNILYVPNTHAETGASSISVGSGQAVAVAGPIQVYSVNGTSAAPPAAGAYLPGATCTTTGANGIAVGGYSGVYGFTFNNGTGSNDAGMSVTNWYTQDCIFNTVTTKVTPNTLANVNNFVPLYSSNCTVTYAATNQCLIGGGGSNATMSIVQNLTFAQTGSIPTILLNPGVGGTAKALFLTIRDSDLSKLTGTILNISNASNIQVLLQNCKLGAGVTIGTPPALANNFIKLHNCDSASTNYRYYYGTFWGNIQHETTIVRTGSLATNGTTPISWNHTSSSSAAPDAPLVSEEIMQWNNLTGGVLTATIYLISGTTLTNNDFWAEIEYQSSSSSPLCSAVNSRVTPLVAISALTSDTSTWGGSTNKYKITLSFTPNKVGPVKARFYLAKASSTVYVDPFIYITDANGNQAACGRNYLIPGFGLVGETAPSYMSAMVDING